MERDFDELEERILKSRALALSKPTAEQESAGEKEALLSFILMGVRYAIPLGSVDAVTRVGEIISIPLTPRHIFGIIRLRGRTYTLISLRHFFHPGDEGLKDADFAIVVHAARKQFAIQAEEIEGVIGVAKEKLVPPPENYDPSQTSFVTGVTMDGLSVLNLDTLIKAPGFGMKSSTI